MLDFGTSQPTHPCTKLSSSNPSMYQIFFPQNPSSYQFYSVFIVKPIHVPKIQAQNPSMYRNLMIFLENDPPMCVHQPFKTHPCTKISRFWGKRTHPCTYIFVSKPIHVHRSYVSMKICEYPPGEKHSKIIFLCIPYAFKILSHKTVFDYILSH